MGERLSVGNQFRWWDGSCHVLLGDPADGRLESLQTEILQTLQMMSRLLLQNLMMSRLILVMQTVITLKKMFF